MKLIHTADLHIGKTVNEFSLIEDQQFFLRQIIELAKKEEADGLIIAGDVYDRSIPSAEAVTLLDEFLSELIAMKIPVFMVSGNHDSPERVGFAGRILEKEGLYIASNPLEGAKYIPLTRESEYRKKQNEIHGTVNGTTTKVCGYGDDRETVHMVLLPYVKPAVLGVRTNQEAVEKMLKEVCEKYPQLQDKDAVKVLVTHYFVTDGGNPPELSDSETTVNVGGLDNVDVSVFQGYDYVALGHIHKPQKIGGGQVYYAGTPMKYSFSETNQEKGVNLIHVHDGENRAENRVKKIPLQPLHDMRKITGRLEELISPGIVASADREDYIQATLTNEEELIDPIGTLRSVYPNTMQIILAKNEIAGGTVDVSQIQKSKSILELYEDFYEIVREEALPEDRREIVLQAIKEIEE